MNAIGKSVIIGSVLLCVAGGIYLIPKLTKDNEEIEVVDYSDIYENIETKTEIKQVQFDTVDEMLEYTQKITTINGVEEASEFITEFLGVCSSGQIEAMLIYYDSGIWNNVMYNNAFPFYDSTGSVLFRASDIEVEAGKDENEYIVKYNVTALDAETKEVLAELKREDKLLLYKDFENIKITDYTRKTVEEKYY